MLLLVGSTDVFICMLARARGLRSRGFVCFSVRARADYCLRANAPDVRDNVKYLPVTPKRGENRMGLRELTQSRIAAGFEVFTSDTKKRRKSDGAARANPVTNCCGV